MGPASRDEPALRERVVIGSVTEYQEQLRRSARAEKSYSQRGITPGPEQPLPHGQLDPSGVDRGYNEAGHAVESPMAEPPRTPPLPPHGRGILTPVELPGVPLAHGLAGPVFDGLAQHHARVTVQAQVPRGEA